MVNIDPRLPNIAACKRFIQMTAALLSLAIVSARSDAQTFAGPSVSSALNHVDQGKLVEADRLIDQAIAAGHCPGAVPRSFERISAPSRIMA